MTTSARARPRLALAAGGAGGGDGGGSGLVLTPELRRALALLQMSRRELVAAIRADLEGEPPSPERGIP